MKKKQPILSFTVKLSKWRCGDDSLDESCRLGSRNADTALLLNNGRMCCLGFATRAAGHRGKMVNFATPEDLGCLLTGLTKPSEFDESIFVDTNFSKKAMEINDNRKTTIAAKQKALIKLGKAHNIEVKFAP